MSDATAIPKLYTIAEVADLFDLHRKTVELMYRRGDIGHVRVGRPRLHPRRPAHRVHRRPHRDAMSAATAAVS